MVAELADPRQAWEALAAAGIIEPEWISHPARRFCGIDGRASRSKWPTSVPMCLALAADAPGVEAVESLEAGWDAVAAFWWDLATRRRGTVPPGLLPRQSRFADKALAGRRLRALRNPFEPMLAIWGLGCGCGELTAHDIVLVVPEIE